MALRTVLPLICNFKSKFTWNHNISGINCNTRCNLKIYLRYIFVPILLLGSPQVFINCSVWLSALVMWTLEPASPQAYQCSDWLANLAHYPHVRLQFSILSWCHTAISHITLIIHCNLLYYLVFRLPLSTLSWCQTVI